MSNVSVLFSYSMHCADTYGDAIYLARIMAETFTDQNFEQYDGCILAPPTLPKISTTQELIGEIRIAPNPSMGMINIEFSQNFSGVLKVMDITGKLIFSKPYFSAKQIDLDLSYNPGINIVQFTSEKGDSKVYKVLVIK